MQRISISTMFEWKYKVEIRIIILIASLLTFTLEFIYLSTVSLEVSGKCPKYNPNLEGTIYPQLDSVSYEEMISKFTWLVHGGLYMPTKCKPRENVAILIPFRDRDEHLRILLNNLHPVLYRQQLEYTVYIVEQVDTKPFNKGYLYNVGYKTAKENQHTCFVFHDVDLIPENDHILYGCIRSPMHLSRAIDKFNYNLPDVKLIGGVSAWKTKEFEQVNGWSNMFTNWGGEDDDMSFRIAANGLSIFRYRNSLAKYKMLKHKRTTVNTARHKLLEESATRFRLDGLSTLIFIPPKIEQHQLFTKILVYT